MPKKRKSNSIAILKTIAAQYSMYGEYASRIFLMYSEYEIEVREVLEYTYDSKVIAASTGGKPIVNTSENMSLALQSKNIDQRDNSEAANDIANDLSSPDSKTWIKKLFKKIAVHCHPDKVNALKGHSSLDRHKRLASYEKARRAVDESDEPKIISVGADYDLVGDIGVEESKVILQSALKTLEQNVSEKQKSAVWAWGVSEGDYDIKARVIKKFALEIYGLTLSQEECKKIVCKFFNIPNNLINERKVGHHPGKRLRQRRKNE
jgi:hypothetical protein